MAKELAIEVKHVSKNFRLPHQKTTTVKKTFVNLLTAWRTKRTTETQHALRDISFSLEKGEFFGIVGRNGSGKSTMLKMLAGIYQPNSGEVKINGRLVPFIELGVGFNPELSGRDNVYLNGALLGFSKAEIDAMYDDIVDFAELQQFMDQKLRNYSSGMEVRLAFSLATRAKADILVVDEVLAVGDADFQRKCYDFFRQLKKTGVTVVFVTHDMSAVREYCDRAILIEDSHLVAEGYADEVATAYTRMFNEELKAEEPDRPEYHEGEERWGDGRVKFESPQIKTVGEGATEHLVLTAKVRINADLEYPVFGFGIKNAAGVGVLGTNTQIKKHRVGPLKAGTILDISWKLSNLLADGSYTFALTSHDTNGVQVFDWWEEAAKFRVRKDEVTAYPITPYIDVETKDKPTQATVTSASPQSKRRFIIDASPLASDRMSGVGHSVYGFVYALSHDPEFTARYQIHLVAPYRGMKYVRDLDFPGVVYRPILLPARVWNRLPGTPLMPPMDLFLGHGTYFLTNFRSWPLLGSKSMVLIHDIAFRLFPDSLTPRHRSFLEHNVPRWMKRATVVVTPSASAKQDLVKHMQVNPKRIAVIPNGVDLDKFSPRVPDEVEAVRAKYQLPSEYILFVGNLEPRKNLSRLIRAYTSLPHDLHQRYALVLIGGSSWLHNELDTQIEQAQAAGARIVRPNGYVTDDDLPAVFSGARLLAWPTLHEGFGMPILEALGTGTPVLTARNSSLPEVAGDAALYVDAANEQQITDGLERLLTEEPLRQKLIAAGHEQAARFTWAIAARKLATLADKLAPDEHK